MNTCLVYGAGVSGHAVVRELLDDASENVVAVSDSNPELWGKNFFGVPIIQPQDIPKYDFGRVYITMTDCESKIEVLMLLIDMGVKRERIIFRQILNNLDSKRYGFVSKIKKLMLSCINGSVAEAGVAQGNFACKLNVLFPDRKLYLFDTFEGFMEQDISAERNISADSANFILKGDFRTSVELVMGKMPYPENIIVKRGWIPDTFAEVDDTFCFVSLDMDLYAPMLNGMRFFYPRMNHGGVMLLHDFYNPFFPGVKKTVIDFENEMGVKLIKVPACDDCSLAIIKGTE